MPADGQLDPQKWSVQAVEYYAAIKRVEAQTQATVWVS